MPDVLQSSQPGSALIVDRLSLRRAGIAAMLEAWARSNHLSLRQSHTDHVSKLALEPVSIAIISLGNAHMREPDCAGMIRSIQQALGSARIAVIADSEEFSDLVAAFGCGVHGYIPTSTEPAIALQALSFVLAGGSYFPPSVLLNSSARLSKVRVTVSRRTVPRDTASASWLTPTQLRVVQLLSVGKSNKVIARDLDVCEATVKAHLRLLMKRLGLSSRTQVAIYFTRAMQARAHNGEVPEELSDDPSDDPEPDRAGLLQDETGATGAGPRGVQ